MEDSRLSHMSFAQLPVEARTLFFIYASAVLARFGSQPPTRRGLAADIETVWNTNRLSKCDLSDPDRMTRLLEQHFAPSVFNTAEKHANRCRAKESK